MKRAHKITFGLVAIALVVSSCLIGLWLLSDVGATDSFAVRFVFRFFLMVTPAIVILAVINLLKADR